MKKFLSASLLAVVLTAAAGQEASAHGNWSLCFGMSWNCWRDFCFPCVDPCQFGLPNGAGYGGGYAGYGGYASQGQPAGYQAPPIYLNAPAGSAAPATSYYAPSWNNSGGYYPAPSFNNSPGNWYGYGY